MVYSPHVSTHLESHYLQPRFNLIENIRVDYAQRLSASLCRKARSISRISVAVYAGKGRLGPIRDELLSAIIDPFRLKTITRSWPRNKTKLYKLLLDSDLLISYDPISSLEHESILLGTPVLVMPPWDEDFIDVFPVSLNGIAFNGDTQFALELLVNGFDHNAVFDSYIASRSNFSRACQELLEFVVSSNPLTADQAVSENSYWSSRQSFFRALSVPSAYSEESAPGVKILVFSKKIENKIFSACVAFCISVRGLVHFLCKPFRALYRRCGFVGWT